MNNYKSVEFLLTIILLTNFFSISRSSVADQQALCPSPFSCLPIRKCKPLMTAIKTTQDSPALVKFLKAQICFYNRIQEPKVCCFDNSDTNKEKQLGESSCKPSFQCVSLSRCGPLMYLVNLEKPVPAGVIKFIRSQQCGTGKNLPKVCCKFKAPGSSLEDPTESVVIEKDFSTTLAPKNKEEVMNNFFNEEFSDFLNYDLFV